MRIRHKLELVEMIAKQFGGRARDQKADLRARRAGKGAFEQVGDEARFMHQGMTSSDVLDTCLAVMQVLYDGLADSKYRPCPLLVKYVEAGWLGRKAGRGFYDYGGEKPVPTR